MALAETIEVTEKVVATGIDWLKWLPVILSACTLLFNIFFYMYFKDYLAFKYSRTADLTKISADFLTYLTEIVSADSFDGVPTKIKNYSEQILLCFKIEEKTISTLLEDLFNAAQKRKNLNSDNEIKQWKEQFRKKTSELQKALRKHCGVIK